MSAVETTQAAGVRTITLRRPDRLNALDLVDRRELRDALRAAADSDARVVVLAGEGRLFCAGGDVRSMSQDADETQLRLAVIGEVALELARCPQPVIARIQGGAFGMGLSLAAGCDLVVAADDASFGTAFTTIGLGPDAGLSYFLPRRVGAARASRMLLLGERISSAEAERIGLVDVVVDAQDLDRRVAEMTAVLVAAAPAALRETKALLARPASLEEAIAAETTAQSALLSTDDFLEGRDALLQRRVPQFTGA